MSLAYLFVAFGYIALAFVVIQFELRRTRLRGMDVTTVFMALCLLQCCIPGIIIYSMLPFIDVAAPTGIDAFDRIYYALDPTTALTVLAFTAWFIVFIYIGSGLGLFLLRPRDSTAAARSSLSLTIDTRRCLVVLGFGLFLTLLSFYQIGDTLATRYTNLILLRAGAPEIERNALNANAFALTQTWGWLAILAIFAAYETKGRGWMWWSTIAFAVVFALLGVSRRALFLPIIFSYLTISLHRARFRLRWVALAAIPMLFWLAYGKELLASLAFGVDVETVTSNYHSWTSALLRAGSDTGLTIVESVGTFLLLPFHLRFGVDHVLSLAQRFPEGVLGWDIDWPERIVRVSTTAFADADAQDIPPGVVGQMWLDFGVAGPVVWGLFFGLQVSVLQALFERTRITYQSAAMFVLLAFLVVLPVNTGSFDFSFNVDIIALVAALAWCARIHRGNPPEPVLTSGPGSFGPVPVEMSQWPSQ
jgi:hypothetical protein